MKTNPDLEIIASKINNSFAQGANLDLNKLKQELGTAIHKIVPPAAESLSTASITNIGLEGQKK
ncbi:hypothetical protein B1207_06830 [Legionella quinlivanii]|uniref:Uncharacterized protein n=1 Tax=Legionella quinlivanii TaxID=45073 RepID=A0A364LKM4_9GAMM|nr:hypothetical protein [Legionella quinlivanii]RAP37129.1 hypothetical protein B1207_06830 [Legionella quinlivanii]